MKASSCFSLSCLLQLVYCGAGTMLRIAAIFQSDFFSLTTMNVLHIFRTAPLAFLISYLQSTTPLLAEIIRSFSMTRLRVPAFVAELCCIPFVADRSPSRHSPVETNWSMSEVRIDLRRSVSRFSRALEYLSISNVMAERCLSDGTPWLLAGSAQKQMRQKAIVFIQ